VNLRGLVGLSLGSKRLLVERRHDPFVQYIAKLPGAPLASETPNDPAI
jgi:hypothetical protein